MNKDLEKMIRKLLKHMGEDPSREGLLGTPKRFLEALEFLTSGYKEDPVLLVKNAVFKDKYDEMVVLKDIPIYSLCEHHLLPFFGKASVAYIPSENGVVGISKIAKMVDMYARRLQLQERLTNQIARTIQNVLKPQGVAVMIKAEHLCMQMRGVQKPGSVMVTSSMQGVFKTNLNTRSEFLAFINH